MSGDLETGLLVSTWPDTRKKKAPALRKSSVVLDTAYVYYVPKSGLRGIVEYIIQIYLYYALVYTFWCVTVLVHHTFAIGQS